MVDTNQQTSLPSPGNKLCSSPQIAVADLFSGATILIAGFAGCGWPETLVQALVAQGAADLTCICHGAWAESTANVDVSALIASGQVRKIISPNGFAPGVNGPAKERWQSGQLEIEFVPQGILVERLRAGGAGLGGVFAPDWGGRFHKDREVKRFGQRDYVFEPPLKADFAFLRAAEADTLGNLVYRGTQRAWNPAMAMAAKVSIAEVDQVHEPGGLDPELVITPGIFVNRVIQTRQLQPLRS